MPDICDITYTYVVTGLPGGDPVVPLFDSATRKFTFDYQPDLLPVGPHSTPFVDYVVTVTGVTGLMTTATQTADFSLRVYNPCPTATLTLATSPFAAETSDMGDPLNA